MHSLAYYNSIDGSMARRLYNIGDTNIQIFLKR
jgi:hypothetical protein